jgi:hypothetical protein
MFSPQLQIDLAKLVVAFVQLPLAVPRAHMNYIKYHVFVFYVPPFVFGELNLKKDELQK